jgi:hypothetical protein
MNDERVAVRRLPAKEPGVAVGAAVQFASIWHIGVPLLAALA